MRKTIVCLAIPLAFAACSRSRIDRDQRQYDVVQEGAASGVTSTIGGPGETLPPMTDTNADTTTAFTLDPRLSTAPPLQQPGTIAGTLPAPGSGVPPYGSQPAARPVPREQPTYTPPPVTTSPRPSTPTTTYPTPTPQPSTPPAVDTATPPSTDTTTTTDGSAPPPDKPKKDKKPKPEPPPPPTDTTATDTAPPPTTDTSGQG